VKIVRSDWRRIRRRLIKVLLGDLDLAKIVFPAVIRCGIR